MTEHLNAVIEAVKAARHVEACQSDQYTAPLRRYDACLVVLQEMLRHYSSVSLKGVCDVLEVL